jgi:membrane fusion protein (multidrug efflux system)
MDGSFARTAATQVRGFASEVFRHAKAADRRRLLLMVVPPIVVLLSVAIWLVANGGTVSTDNATVSAARAPISASVRGRVMEVLVRENQSVRAGDTLLRLDAGDFRRAVLEAEARLATARLQVSAFRAAYGEAIANRRAAEATAAHAGAEYRRQQNLFRAGVVSRQDLDRAQVEADVAAREASAAAQAEATALANLGGATDAPTDSHPLVMQALAALEGARSDLADIEVKAPVDGVVARVSQVQIGAYVQPAQTLFYLVSGAPWIDAAFKENQIDNLQPGQHVRIRIDAFPGQSFAGHVESFSPGTGSSFALLPAENATGNWVHVVQRLSVRIVFDELPPEAARAMGLSARVQVDTRGGQDAARLRGRRP